MWGILFVIVFILELTGGTKSESKASIQSFSQPVPFQRNQFFPNANPIMRSSILSNPASTISNISSHRSGTISMRSQTSSIPKGYGDYESGDGRSSMSRSECYSEYSSTMSIEEIDNFYTSKSRFSLDTARASYFLWQCQLSQWEQKTRNRDQLMGFQNGINIK